LIALLSYYCLRKGISPSEVDSDFDELLDASPLDSLSFFMATDIWRILSNAPNASQVSHSSSFAQAFGDPFSVLLKLIHSNKIEIFALHGNQESECCAFREIIILVQLNRTAIFILICTKVAHCFMNFDLLLHDLSRVRSGKIWKLSF
jgi:hypothetical protein